MSMMEFYDNMSWDHHRRRRNDGGIALCVTSSCSSFWVPIPYSCSCSVVVREIGRQRCRSCPRSLFPTLLWHCWISSDDDHSSVCMDIKECVSDSARPVIKNVKYNVAEKGSPARSILDTSSYVSSMIKCCCPWSMIVHCHWRLLLLRCWMSSSWCQCVKCKIMKDPNSCSWWKSSLLFETPDNPSCVNSQ